MLTYWLSVYKQPKHYNIFSKIVKQCCDFFTTQTVVTLSKKQLHRAFKQNKDNSGGGFIRSYFLLPLYPS